MGEGISKAASSAALGILQGAAELGNAAASLAFGTKPSAFLSQCTGLVGRFSAKRRKAVQKFSAIFWRIGNKAGRGLFRPGRGCQQQQKGKDPSHAIPIRMASLPGCFGLMKPASCAGTQYQPSLKPRRAARAFSIGQAQFTIMQRRHRLDQRKPQAGTR